MAILSLFNRLGRQRGGRGRSLLRVSHAHHSKDEKSTLTTTIEDDIDGAGVDSCTEWLHRCMECLSSTNEEESLLGLARLLEMTRESDMSKQIALGLIYGTDQETLPIRYLLIRFLSKHCIELQDDDDMRIWGSDDDSDGSVYLSDTEDASESENGDYDDDGDDHEKGREISEGVHHEVALQILLLSLEKSSRTDGCEGVSINYRDAFWKATINTLTINIENNFSPEITTLTLSCLRLLHTLDPSSVETLLSYVLLPYLSYLTEYGRDRGLPIIQQEASKLWARARNEYSLSLILR